VGARFARNLIMEQIRLGLKGEGEPARRAREFILRFTMMSRPRRQDVPGESDRRPDWILEDFRRLGGVPWEDKQDAEREREAREEAGGEGRRQTRGRGDAEKQPSSTFSGPPMADERSAEGEREKTRTREEGTVRLEGEQSPRSADLVVPADLQGRSGPEKNRRRRGMGRGERRRIEMRICVRVRGRRRRREAASACRVPAGCLERTREVPGKYLEVPARYLRST